MVGGGPAGLEAARTAALRGHEVHLYEMTGQLGGQVAVAARAPHRGDVQAITRFLADEATRLGVHVHLRTPVDPDLVVEQAPGRRHRRHRFHPAARRLPAVQPVAAGARRHAAARVHRVGRARPRRPGDARQDCGGVRRHGDVRGDRRGGRARRRRCVGDDRQPPRAARGQRARTRRPPSRPAGSGCSVPACSSSRRWPCRRSRPTRSSCEASATSCAGRSLPTRSSSPPTTSRTPSSPTTCATPGLTVHVVGNATGTDTIQAAIHGAAAICRTI